ncbi:hypothetical protein A374_04869 [Fictibacillus macauensis ZFHKF-1]|uniref:Sporulation inhibitor of replication protein SirA n=1 Tax=Fictibacillus macauensis ZFHKF-1 TaxID=1196324 RepID=I8UJ66_9BACL|nr:sporulation inhibitor of replication protein SirA [Fictibacillus macauensis]EIT86878.1 hypothetical protein A374_04869 [Fictibacillus macauensis ZFHKF-1]
MREYYIYQLHEGIAEDYFGKEQKLYQLFLDEYRSQASRKTLLRRQIQYITKELHAHDIVTFLNAKLLSYEGFVPHDHSLLLECCNSSARLIISNHYLLLQSEGSFEAESILFELLRKYGSGFLAMDLLEGNYGWLNPLKPRRSLTL